MPTTVVLKLNQAEINRMLGSPTGPVGNYIYRLAIETAMEARKTVPVKSGKLKSSIETSRGPRGSMDVTANSPYALAVHEGTKAHTINPGRVMKFPSKKGGGKFMFAPVTHQPATKANPFLMNALRHVIAMHR